MPLAARLVELPDRNQPVRFRIGERAEQDPFSSAVDRCGPADSQSKREKRNHRKGWPPQKDPGPEQQVAAQLARLHQPPRVPRRSAEGLARPELDARPPPCLLRVETVLSVLRLEKIKMLPHLGVEIAFGTAAPEQEPKLAKQGGSRQSLNSLW